jgi:anti-sigma regulatory factor (Ser/Thr protein kinase)
VLAVRHDPSSAALVRQAIADDLTRQSIHRDSVDDVILVASELVGNAVMHAPASGDRELGVDWDVEPEAVIVCVNDASPDVPRRRSTNEEETGGRGLAIVAAIAADWGVRHTEVGKQVWARVPVVRA